MPPLDFLDILFLVSLTDLMRLPTQPPYFRALSELNMWTITLQLVIPLTISCWELGGFSIKIMNWLMLLM